MSPRSILFPLASMMTAVCMLGCPLLKKKADDNDKTVDAAAGGLGAKNEASVLRYDRETPIEHVSAVIGADGTKVRTFPGNGPEVATLAKGTTVTKIAQYFATGTLILFDDPAGDGTKLIGWVTPTVFDAAVPAKPVPKPIAPSVVRVVDAGATAVKDAGAPAPAPAAKDAGATPVAVVDAGKPAAPAADTPPPQPPKGTVAVAPDGKGRCPDGWVIAPDMCRHKCTADSECPRNTKCTTKGNQKVCSSDH